MGDWAEMLQAKIRQKIQEGQRTITEAGGLVSFLKNEMPAIYAVAPDLVLDYVAGNIDSLRDLNQRLTDCKDCGSGERCADLQHWQNPGKRFAGINAEGAVVYEQCSQWTARQYRQQLRWMGIPPLFHGCSFDTFRATTQAQKKALEQCREFASKPQQGLLLAGPWGTGKTHLAVSILRALFDHAKRTDGLRFVVVPKLLAEARDAIRSNSASPISAAMDASVLVLDDVGAEKVTDWVREQLFLLINDRYENEKITIITTNCNLSDLEGSIGGAAVSRIYGMCKGLVVDGEDYRRRRDV